MSQLIWKCWPILIFKGGDDLGIFNFGKKGVARDPSTDKLFEVFFDNRKRMLSEYGMQVVANFISRTFMTLHADSDSDVNIQALNVKPNLNQNASEFWRDIVYKLIMKNEVLVVLNKDKSLLVADDFMIDDFANYQNVYKGVSVGNFTFQRSFVSNEVWHITLNTDDWRSSFIKTNEELDNIYNYVINNVKMRNQLRATLGIDSNASLTNKTEIDSNLKIVMDKARKAIGDKQIAIIPELNGIKYDEKSQSYQTGVGVDEIGRLKKLVIEDAAAILGVPTALLSGTQADTSGVSDQYKENVVMPILIMIQRELQMKLSDPSISLSFERDMSIVRNSEQIDKLISSGFATRNMIAEIFGMESTEGGDEFIMTKNYEQANKGGDVSD